MLYRRLPKLPLVINPTILILNSQSREHTLIVKAVDAINACALVVAAQDEKVLGILDLVREEQADRLQALLSTVDVVTQEQIIRFWREATVLEQAEQIVILAVDITYGKVQVKPRVSVTSSMVEE